MPSPEPGEEFDPAKHRPKLDRSAPHPGPRCTTHNRIKDLADSIRSHARRVVKFYGITSEFYWALYEFQGGKCYICERAYGKSKRLAVDHNHICVGEHPPDKACELCVRGLLCTTCNRKIVGHLRDDPEAFRRGAEYLENPPAQRLMQSLAA